MAKPVSILGDVRGMARDYSLDQLPKGYVWDLVNYIPRRRGARLDGRRAWKFLTPASSMAGPVTGGYHAPYAAGTSLLVGAGGSLYSIDTASGVATLVGSLFATGKQNGRMLRQRVYFADGAGLQKPKYVTRSGSTHTPGQIVGANAPAGSLLGVYRDRLVVSGNPASPQTVYFSPLESDTVYGPPSTGTWDPKSQYDTSLAVTAIWPMSAQILCFHNGSIEKLRGTKPAQTLADGDFALDPFTDQVGCSDPASVVGWQENVVWAAPRGVYLSDGSTIRSLTEQGGISELWRTLYNQKRPATQVTAAVFLDLLFVSVLTDWDVSYPYDLRPFTLVCDLNERSWYRFANMGMTAAIPSQTDAEEVWWGSDGVNFASNYQNRLARFSDMMFTESEVSTLSSPLLVTPTPVDQIDGNAVAMLPQIETGFLKLGPEGRKRFRNILISHTTEMAAASPTTNKLRVGYRLRPYPYVPFTTVGDIPGIDGYRRYRVRLDKAGYGISVKVEQTVPTAISRLHDIAIDLWALDRGHL